MVGSLAEAAHETQTNVYIWNFKKKQRDMQEAHLTNPPALWEVQYGWGKHEHLPGCEQSRPAEWTD